MCYKVLWGLVNNAGVSLVSGLPAEMYSIDDYRRMFDVNLFGMALVTSTFLPLLMMSKGRIVNTCCVMGTLAIPGNPPYLASKWAVTGWSEALRY